MVKHPVECSKTIFGSFEISKKSRNFPMPWKKILIGNRVSNIELNFCVWINVEVWNFVILRKSRKCY